ncbi:MAG: cyclic nucleotide-binding domain-containing protein [Rubrivivax sp.]|jgi:CRP-like cAMP-binding protein|nr:cyclic nucleotide-binding domain-containing protein [Rubrivivax sp.]
MDDRELARRLEATPTFSRLPIDAVAALVGRSRRIRATAGCWLNDAAAAPRDHLILLAGELEVHRAWIDDDGRPQGGAWRVGVVPEGPGFAWVPAGSGGVRIQALEDAEAVAVDADELDALLGWHDAGRASLSLRQAPLLQRLPIENAQRVFDRMTERPAAAGETIVAQGDPGDAYYILLAGEAEVWVRDPFTDESARTSLLGPGDGFGEEALLLQGRRTATVRMLSPGRLLVLARSDFDELLEPPLVEQIDAARARDLLRDGRATLLDCRYGFEYDEGRIPGARHVPLDRIRQQGVFSLDPADTHIVYCRSGRRSKAAAFLLRERGFRALSLAGGLADWPYEVEGEAV